YLHRTIAFLKCGRRNYGAVKCQALRSRRHQGLVGKYHTPPARLRGDHRIYRRTEVHHQRRGTCSVYLGGEVNRDVADKQPPGSFPKIYGRAEKALHEDWQRTCRDQSASVVHHELAGKIEVLSLHSSPSLAVTELAVDVI